MKRMILSIFLICTVSLLAEEKTIKLGPFIMKKVKETEQKVKLENVVIKKIEDNIIYLENGEIKMEEPVSDVVRSNPNFITDLSGTAKRVQEINFPVVADIEVIEDIKPSEILYGNIKKVLRIVIKGTPSQKEEKKE